MKKQNTNQKIKTKTLASFEIFIILLGVISFSFFMGDHVKLVSADNPDVHYEGDTCTYNNGTHDLSGTCLSTLEVCSKYNPLDFLEGGGNCLPELGCCATTASPLPEEEDEDNNVFTGPVSQSTPCEISDGRTGNCDMLSNCGRLRKFFVEDTDQCGSFIQTHFGCCVDKNEFKEIQKDGRENQVPPTTSNTKNEFETIQEDVLENQAPSTNTETNTPTPSNPDKKDNSITPENVIYSTTAIQAGLNTYERLEKTIEKKIKNGQKTINDLQKDLKEDPGNVLIKRKLEQVENSLAKTKAWEKKLTEGTNGLEGAALIKETRKLRRKFYEEYTGKTTFLDKFSANFFKSVKSPKSSYSLTWGGYTLQALGVATVSSALVYGVFELAGAGDRNMNQILKGSIASSLATTTLVSLSKLVHLGQLPLFYVGGASLLLTTAYALLSYQNFAQEIISYSPTVWQPQTGGENCEQCNLLPHGCSEYQCHSYGAGCELINKGTEDEQCFWNNSQDFNPPIVSVLDEALDLVFEFDEISNNSAKLIYVGENPSPNNCIPAFNGVKIAVKTSELAQCKLDIENKFSYDEMLSFFSEGSTYTYNHTIDIDSSAFPSSSSLENLGILVENGRTHEFYVRCQDSSGNLNPTNYLIHFCVDETPDTTPPEISTNYYSEKIYVKVDKMFVDDLIVYTNEPATCKWDLNDVSYETMANNMTDCSKNITDYKEGYSYGCDANLTGIRNNELNKYYIRCKDKPWLGEINSNKEYRVENKESYVFEVVGTEGLAISEITANKEILFKENKIYTDYNILDSTIPIKISLAVKTSQGAQGDGSSRCTYRLNGTNFNYDFYNEGNYNYVYNNVHDLYLSEQKEYNYSIKCCDIAGNCDEESIKFKIEIDTDEPKITRAYYDGAQLKIITNEKSTCVYSTDTCIYNPSDGLELKTNDGLEHFVNWNTEIDLHIKCLDVFENAPEPEECQLIARAHSA